MTKYEYSDLMQLFEGLRSQGWNPQLCDTPIPYYDGRVPCGPLTGVGDTERGEYVMFPIEMAQVEPVYTLTVRGDSMKDAGIASGDELRVLATHTANDGDVVVALIDGEYTVKMLFTDEQGRRWLVPRNAEYNAMLLTEEMDVRIVGCVQQVIKPVRRASYATLMRTVNKAMARMAQEEMEERSQELPAQRLTAMLSEAYGGQMASASDWIAVYRVLVDRCGTPSSYTAFAEYINGIAPEGFPRCTADLLRKADPVYMRPLYEWTPDMAPSVRISVLDRRVAIAKHLAELL